MKKLGGAIIGCGGFSQNHAQAWHMIDEVNIVALCDIDTQRCQVLSDILGTQPKFYSSFDELLRYESIDFVDICTRVETHEALVLAAAQAKLHVICQKPLALDVDSTERMLAALHSAGVKHLVHENFRFQPAIRYAFEQMKHIGQVFSARISFRSAHDVFAAQPYLATDKKFILMDVGVHLFDLARFFLGDITEQHCVIQRVNPHIQGEDVATVLTRHTSGASSVIDMSYASKLSDELFPQTLLQLEGSLGSIEILPHYQVRTTIGHEMTHADLSPKLLDWFVEPFVAVQSSVLALQRHWVNCLLNHQPVEIDFADNLKTLKAVFACYEEDRIFKRIENERVAS